jgi:hypothetical protein
MRLQHIHPHPLLREYIAKLWIFESDGPVPSEDMKLIVPNGHVKLVIPFRNGLSGKMEKLSHLSKEHSLTLIGIADVPAVVEAQSSDPAGTIGIEFNPLGAYRFFHIHLSELRNSIHSLTSVLGKAAKELEEQISNAESLTDKILLVQKFLLHRLASTECDTLYDYTVRRIAGAKGKITVRQLEKETGYSARWLNMKFTENIGISPKNLSSIFRFQQFYQSWARGNGQAFFQKEFYDFFYDQSHFIKDFKRFTGHTPAKFIGSENEFGRIFYNG